MQSHRVLSGLTIFLMVALVAIGYFVVAQPQIAASSAAGVQLASVETAITQSQTTVTQLKSQQKDLPTLKAQLAALKLSIPSSVDSSAYINGLTAVASAAGVTITGISVGDAVAYASPVAAAAPAAAAAGGSASPSPSPSATGSAPAAAAATSTAWVPTTDALISGSDFIAIPVKVVTSGSIDGDLAFIKGLQTGPRLFLVTGFSTVKAADTGVVTSSIGGYIYVIVDPADKPATTTGGTTTAAPSTTVTTAPKATATPNPSGSATPTPTQSSTPTTKP